jgi:hypothetical protein
MDTKLGKELFDYDFFLEKFKNSYAFKYAPQLNDKAFFKFFLIDMMLEQHKEYILVQ